MFHLLDSHPDARSIRKHTFLPGKVTKVPDVSSRDSPGVSPDVSSRDPDVDHLLEETPIEQLTRSGIYNIPEDELGEWLMEGELNQSRTTRNTKR
jgi:hypothetical protein